MNAGVRTALVFALAALLWLPVLGATEPAGDQQTAGRIVGRVFLDENANATFEECDCDCALADIPVRLYQDHCGGLILQTAKTDAEGYFHFDGLEAGDYCVMPRPKTICEGFKPTKSMTQKVHVEAGATTEAEWFAFDHFLDRNDSQ
jgi:hypothetical protein